MVGLVLTWQHRDRGDLDMTAEKRKAESFSVATTTRDGSDVPFFSTDMGPLVTVTIQRPLRRRSIESVVRSNLSTVAALSSPPVQWPTVNSNHNI